MNPIIWTICTAGAGVIAFLTFLGFRRRKARRRHHIETHKPLCEAEFLTEAGISLEHMVVAIGVRDGVAESMGVPAVTLHPKDAMGYIKDFHSIGPDWLAIEFGIERALKIRIPKKFPLEGVFKDKTIETATPADFDAITVADLANLFIANWHLVIPRKMSADTAN